MITSELATDIVESKIKIELPKREDSYEFTLQKCGLLSPSENSVEKV